MGSVQPGAQVQGSLRGRLLWLVAAGAFAYFAMLQFYGVNLGEESATVFLLYRTARGELPYVDFISGYTPGYFFFHALLYRWFGEHLSVVRLALVAVHTVNVVLLFRIGLQFLSPAWSLVAAFAYPALLPVVETSELSFNVPYPAWYCIGFFLLGWLVVERARTMDRRPLWFLAGVLAGASFAFKPNSGLFQVAFAMIAASAGLTSVSRAWGVIVAVSVVAGVIAVFRHHLFGATAFVFLAPFVVTVVAWLWYSASGKAKAGQRATALRPIACVAAGFALATLPWLLPYWFRLGTGRVWREVLFVGSGYEQHFYIPYDWTWSLFFLAGGGLLVLWWWPVVARGRVVRWFAAAALAAVAVGVVAYAVVAPKPEGVVESVISAVRKTAFVGVPLVHWVVGLAALAAVALRRRNPEMERLVLLSLGAQALFWNAYPRSDFFHLAYAAPLSFVLGAYLAQEWVSRWVSFLATSETRCRPAWIAPAVAFGVLVVCATPQLRVGREVVSFFLGWRSALEWWNTPRALVLIRSDAAGDRQRAFAAVARWLAARQERGGYLFTFPDLDLLGFLTAMPHPTRIGYFKSGWPGHAVEAEVVDELDRRPPRFVVTEYPPSLFFYDAAGFFFLLKHWVEQRYVVEHQVGRFRLWVPRNASSGSASRSELAGGEAKAGGELTSAWQECDRGALQAIRRRSDQHSVTQWVEAWAQFGVRAWDVGCARLGLRVAGELGDAHAGWSLASVRLGTDSPLYAAWANALWNIALRNLLLRWQFGGPDARFRMTPLPPEQAEQIVQWLAHETDPRLRFYFAWVLGSAGPTEFLRQALREANRFPDAPTTALERGLLAARLEDEVGEWVRLAEHFAEFPSILPPLFLEWAARSPVAKAEVVERALHSNRAGVREVAAYLAVPLDECRPCATLQQLEKNDPVWEVRRAAAWAGKRLECRVRCTSAGVSR